ncbi:MAG: prepilin-type N-terminal cleavage/methylation domain-containing protein [Phycisphaerae bacterium]
MRCTHKRSARGGFSLIEVAVATAVVGIALAALLVAVGSNTRVNDAGAKLTRAAFLAQEMREWTLALPFSDPDPADADHPPGPDGSNPQYFVDDLDDLIGVTYSPPRDGQGNQMYGMSGWSQAITLTWRDPNSVSTTVTAGMSDVICVEVDVAFEGQSVVSTNWLVTRREGE